MAKCQLNIVLDEPSRPRIGGEKIRGSVVVRADQSVACLGLEVISSWATHGAGNIDRGEIDRVTVFDGTWEEGQKYQYPFELDSASWPPTYYGHLLNVGQFVEARAKLSWAIDPKATVEFPVVVTTAPENLAPVTKSRPTTLVGWVVGLVFGLLLLVPLLLLLGMAIVVILPLALIGGAVTWFVWGYLPSRLTGRVQCEVLPLRVAAGDSMSVSLSFTPRRSLTVNGITWKVTATERCESGSGSNRKTHTHKVFEESRRLVETGILDAGVPQSHTIAFPIPATAPSSLKFSDNELRWEGELRIDIPGWPDWVKSFKLTVIPAPNAAVESKSPESEVSPVSDSDLTFDELAKLVTALAVDPDRRKLAVDALTGRTFDVTLDLDSADDDGSREGTWLDGWHRPTDLDVELLWPDGVTPPLTPVSGWKGKAIFTGFDASRDCVLMRATPLGRA